ncbi:hypothetical protein O181_030872 [Austropuccinia psidii MF-1]|uniref:Uncharacterized protein n=1 Tax=Austropuccinia psidii MF-1 TaxID=1389203 RepID=A0A9Q3H4U2_9BASI|nr:hypothetical protein [Austropuccinia psidii MF-1]
MAENPSSKGIVIPVTVSVRQSPPPKDPETQKYYQHLLNRKVLFFVPYSTEGVRGCPLIIAFHGANEEPDKFRTRTTADSYDNLAARERMIVAYPQGYKKHWNDLRHSVSYPPKVEGVDELSFTKSIIDHAADAWDTSRDKTFLVGYSNGAHLVFDMLLKLGPEHITAAAVHCAGYPDDEFLLSRRPKKGGVPLCILNGTQDPVNPYGGGSAELLRRENNRDKKIELGKVLSSLETLHHFRRHFNMLLRFEEFQDPAGNMNIAQWSTTDANPVVLLRLVSMIGEGHYIPIGNGPKDRLVLGPRRGAVNAPVEGKSIFTINTFSKK